VTEPPLGRIPEAFLHEYLVVERRKDLDLVVHHFVLGQ